MNSQNIIFFIISAVAAASQYSQTMISNAGDNSSFDFGNYQPQISSAFSEYKVTQTNSMTFPIPTLSQSTALPYGTNESTNTTSSQSSTDNHPHFLSGATWKTPTA